MDEQQFCSIPFPPPLPPSATIKENLCILKSTLDNGRRYSVGEKLVFMQLVKMAPLLVLYNLTIHSVSTRPATGPFLEPLETSPLWYLFFQFY
jgi:hypothetical protein